MEPQAPERDVGVDFLVVISEDSDLDMLEFRTQIKASQNSEFRDGNIIIPNIKITTLEYWFLSPLPTFIVVNDRKNNKGYYCWHSDILDQFHSGTLNAEQKNLY